MSENTTPRQKMIESICESSAQQLDWLLENKSGKNDHVDQRLVHAITQTHLLTKMLETLDNINEKLAMMNINIQDVEQEVSKLNPRYIG